MTKKGEQSTTKAWLIVMVALLDDIVVLALIFLVLWFFKVKIPLSAIIVIGLVLGTFTFIVHRAVVPSLGRRKVAGAEGMIGLVGEVKASLKPNGVVLVGGEHWQAKSVDGNIAAGEDVEIVGIVGLKLEVKRKAS